MRLWHKDLIPYLPRQQLLSQFRELRAIARCISLNGTPNHILVNKIMDYPDEHLDIYAYLVLFEFIRRGYRCNFNLYKKWRKNLGLNIEVEDKNLFDGWHNLTYLRMNMANLAEKAWNGGIPPSEWEIVKNGYKNITGNEYEL